MEREAAFLVALAEYGIRPDMQEVLVRGNPDLDIRPGALKHALAAIQAVQMEAVAWQRMSEDGVPTRKIYFEDDEIPVVRGTVCRPLYASPVPSSERDELGGIFLIETERVGDQDRFSIWDVFNECFQPGFYLTRMDAIAAIKKLRPLPDRDDIIEMCAATVERHVRDIDARPDSWMAAWAKECAAKLRSLKSSGEGST